MKYKHNRNELYGLFYCLFGIISSGSVAANYIEANEKLGDKDFKFRLKISRKEAKESVLWLKLLRDLNSEDKELVNLINEAEQLRKILSAIINKS